MGTALRRAMEEGCVDSKRSTHVGIHGSMGSADLMKEDAEKGWLTITMDDFVEKGPVEVANIVKERIGDAKAIISNDVTAHACAQSAYEIMCLALDNIEAPEGE